MLRYKTKTRPGLVALYDIRPGNGAGPFLQPRSPYGAFLKFKDFSRLPLEPCVIWLDITVLQTSAYGKTLCSLCLHSAWLHLPLVVWMSFLWSGFSL